MGDLDKSDGFSESGESFVSGNLVIIVILVILVLLVIMVILVIFVIGNFIITFVSLGRPTETGKWQNWVILVILLNLVTPIRAFFTKSNKDHD